MEEFGGGLCTEACAVDLKKITIQISILLVILFYYIALTDIIGPLKDKILKIIVTNIFFSVTISSSYNVITHSLLDRTRSSHDLYAILLRSKKHYEVIYHPFK